MENLDLSLPRELRRVDQPDVYFYDEVAKLFDMLLQHAVQDEEDYYVNFPIENGVVNFHIYMCEKPDIYSFTIRFRSKGEPETSEIIAMDFENARLHGARIYQIQRIEIGHEGEDDFENIYCARDCKAMEEHALNCLTVGVAEKMRVLLIEVYNHVFRSLGLPESKSTVVLDGFHLRAMKVLG